MKILHIVEQYSPSVGGMQEVVKQLSEKLVAFGHEVFVATSDRSDRKVNNINGVKIESFKIQGNMVMGYVGSPEEIERYKEFLLNSDFDIITGFAAQQWSVDILLENLDCLKAKKVFVPTGFSRFYDKRYEDYFLKMKNWIKKFDLNIFLSNNYRDIDFVRENGVEKLLVIPNGASAEEFLNPLKFDFRKKNNISPDNFLVLLVGSHTRQKGHEEAIKIFSQANLKKSTLLIIANIYSIRCYLDCEIKSFVYNIFSRNKIIIRSFSRAETVAAYRNSDLFLFPSNIECSPIVLFESMASKLPFLTTDVGNSKEIIKWSNGGLLLPTKKDGRGYSHALINESANLLKELYNDKIQREKLAINGFNAWKENFSWEKIARDYEEQYKKLLGIL